MKKVFILLIVVFTCNSVFAGSYVDKQLKEAKKNTKYNSVQKFQRDYSSIDAYVNPEYIKDLKDPKLIKFEDYTKVDETAYKQKLLNDEKIYNKEIIPQLNKKMNSVNIDPSAVDFYKVYRISERLIRANNLDYTNWRLALRKTEDINAYSSAVNYISINTALYDSLYNNEEALAFVIAHEMSHLILGHQQRLAELNKKLGYLAKNKTVANTTAEAFADIGYSLGSLYQMKRIYDEVKNMEFLADSEAFILVTKAGYSPSKAIEALNFLDVLPQVKRFIQTHPVMPERIESAKENIYYANPSWVEEGKSNIFYSNVLPCKKSSDRVSIVINASENPKKYYKPENIEQRLTRLSYMSYTKGNMTKAEKYFKKLANLTNSYIPYLYLSYTEEQMYSATKNDKYFKNAQNYVKKAVELNPNDENVKKQINDLNAL